MTDRPRPNILLITSHDIGRYLGCYGIPTVRSGHIDRIADQGVRFDRAFATAPLCSPSRASIFTGRCPHATGVNGLTHGAFGYELNDDELHLARYLADAGYACEHFGVCHESHRPPTELGYHLCHNPGMVAADSAQAFEQRLKHHADAAGQGSGPRPWYMHIGFFEPHTPFDWGGARPDDALGVTIPPFLEANDGARRAVAAFQGAIRSLDDAVGRVLKALDEADQAENTVVMFTADHGVPFPRAKGTLYDDGLAVSLLVRWPRGGWSGGRSRSELISHLDHVPTLLETLGVGVPERVQGRSYGPALDGLDNWTGSEAVFGEITCFNAPMYQPRRSIRTDRHRLILNLTNDPPLPPGPWFPDVDVIESIGRRWRDLVPWGAVPPLELYDVERDPFCLHDLAQRPEPEPRAALAELSARLLAWMRDTDDPWLSDAPPPPPCHAAGLARLRAAAVMPRS